MQRARPTLWAAALTVLLVREPGCGCCLTCALSEGQPCGIYTERCGSGLRCQPSPDEARPLQALLDGRGLCVNSSAVSRLRAYLLPAPPAPGNASESEEDRSAGSVESPSVSSTHRVSDPKFHPVHSKIIIIKKGHAKDSQRYKVDYESQSTDTQNFSSESKRETEYGPCRREMEDTLNHLKFLNVLSPRGVHIPNCDKKGFYKKKQCRPSKGRKRGFCWCVDKYGQPLPGYTTKGKEDVHCYSMQSK
ncbi:insulin-like growth factor-binding protein 3 isoform X3 [Theropithecus gelada]|uniref:insulin-like growth factor-binding protein 3 isoform X3 n=1 Tax=Theropithecus gelada TaxID=9565 RepID=UPI000DC183A9|nr:insulin-like growth factor-binding protein 3 isoform X3 [Theropithecus gelada]